MEQASDAEEASWMRNHGGGIVEDASGGIMEEASGQHHGGGTIEGGIVEGSREAASLASGQAGWKKC